MRNNKSQERFKELTLSAKKKDDRCFCSVIAVALLCRVSYKKAYETCEFIGRKHGGGMVTIMIIQAIRCLGFSTELVPTTVRCTPSNVSDKLGGTGRYLCVTSDHALAYINGKVADWTDGRKHTITGIYKVKKLSNKNT